VDRPASAFTKPPGTVHRRCWIRDKHTLPVSTKVGHVSQIQVLVATIAKDLTAEVISTAVARSTGMTLLGSRVVSVFEIEELLTELPPVVACALVLVGPASETEAIETRWLSQRRRLVVLRLDTVDDIVHLAARRVGMDALLAALCVLLDRAAVSPATTGWGQCLRHIDSMRSICRLLMSSARPSTIAGLTLVRRAERVKHAKRS
jgi:hypothetical protein